VNAEAENFLTSLGQCVEVEKRRETFKRRELVGREQPVWWWVVNSTASAKRQVPLQ
jgi:hypothetical protein